jgi:hypothetical protein
MRRQLKDDARGGGEVYDMFNAANHCVLDDKMFAKIDEIVTAQSDTDYCLFTRNGRVFCNHVVTDIQRHMDAYYNFKKSDFPKKLYPDAYEMMEVYIKTMYLIERGLLQPGTCRNESDHRQVNILWGDIGTFRVFRFSS